MFNFECIDLTHSLEENSPTWEGISGFKEYIDVDYDNDARAMSYEMFAGVGTHIDAPSHFIKDGDTIAEIKLRELIVKSCVIDIRHKVKYDDAYMLSVEDIKDFENKHGEIKENSVVIAYTGWSVRWPDSPAYRNPDADGKMHFPGFSVESADYLLKKAIAGIGIDTLSPDISHDFPVHKKILGAGKYIIENLANLDKMPPWGAYIFALPLKIKNATEAPARVVGLIPKD